MPTETPTPINASTLAIAADLSLRYITGLTRDTLRQSILAACTEQWIVECVRELGESCIAPIGRYDLLGVDDETPWPACVAIVERTSWNAAISPRKTYVGVYLDESANLCCTEFEALNQRQFIGPLPVSPVP